MPARSTAIKSIRDEMDLVVEASTEDEVGELTCGVAGSGSKFPCCIACISMVLSTYCQCYAQSLWW